MFAAAIARYRSAYAGLPRDVWLLAVVIFVNSCGTMVMPFMTLYLTGQLGMSESLAGGLISVYGLGSILGAYCGGRFSDRFGEIRLQTVCMFLAAPGYLLIGVWKSWPPIAATLFVLSAVMSACRPANQSAVAKISTPENRTRAFALLRLAHNFGFSFGPALGGVLASINFWLLFVVDAVTTLLAAVALYQFFGMKRLAPPHDHHALAGPHPSPLRDAGFVAFLGLMFVSALSFFQFGSTYPLYLQDHFSFTKPLIGMMFAVNTTIIVAFEMVLLDAIKHWPRLRTIGWGTLLTCVGFGILPFGQSMAYAVFAMLVFTVGEMLSVSFAAAYVANRAPRGREAFYIGWYTTMLSVALVFGPAAGTALYAVNQAAPWYASLAIGAIVLVGFHLLALHSEPDDARPIAEILPEGFAPETISPSEISLPPAAEYCPHDEFDLAR
jgi:predicted MFS family arabinose efflux permease